MCIYMFYNSTAEGNINNSVERLIFTELVLETHVRDQQYPPKICPKLYQHLLTSSKTMVIKPITHFHRF